MQELSKFREFLMVEQGTGANKGNVKLTAIVGNDTGKLPQILAEFP